MTPAHPLLPDAAVTVIDIRPQELRWAQPLDALLPNPVIISSLERIERKQHGLTGTVVVVCEIGLRSNVAAMYLRADGVHASHVPGGVRALKQAAPAPASALRPGDA